MTEYGADLLTQAGVRCEPRGVINIKGKGNMKTFFVCMNDNFEIQYIKPEPGSMKDCLDSEHFPELDGRMSSSDTDTRLW